MVYPNIIKRYKLSGYAQAVHLFEPLALSTRAFVLSTEVLISTNVGGDGCLRR